MVVITVVDIDYGRIFGPFPVTSTGMDPTYAIGMLTQDKTRQGPALEVRCRKELNYKSFYRGDIKK